MVIHSKSGSPRDGSADAVRGGSDPRYLRQSCEQSLKNLGIETLDVFCMSRVDPDVPVEESVGGMAERVNEGKTRFISLSECSAESLRRGSAVHPLVSLQMEYSLFSRDGVDGSLSEDDFFTGLGYWTRANIEPCLLATRGHPKRKSKKVKRLIISPRREHSRKPDEIYERIEELVEGPYVELFARTSRERWESWGDQTSLFDNGHTPTRRFPSDLKKYPRTMPTDTIDERER